jgi:hypothetical protein
MNSPKPSKKKFNDINLLVKNVIPFYNEIY